MDITTMLSQLGSGMVVSIEIFVLTLLFALPLGLLIAVGRMSKFKILSGLVKVYIAIMRGTPLMLQLIVVYFAPYYVFGIKLSSSYRFIAVIIAFSINYAAYFAEIFRAGIQSISRGQYEAAKTLGMTYGQTMRRIVIPQMIRHVLPPISNETINLVKDTSLARIIALQEVIWAGQAFMKGSQGISGAIWPLFFTGVYYLVFNGVLTLFFGWLERKMDYFKV